METRRPLIVDVARGRLEDGPGIRTVVFFKGCTLRCAFCQNPETQETGPELAFTSSRCLNCGVCAAACPQSAIDLDSQARIDRGRCDLCGRCADACPSSAVRIAGTYWPVDRLANVLLRDVPFYRSSGGGVTLSGGECTMFPEYLEVLLQRLAASRIHITLETSGVFDYGVFARRILPYVHLVLYDVRQPNSRILENLRQLLAESSVEVHPRIPLIPGITDDAANLAAIVDELFRVGATRVSLLPYNPLGLAMYAALGRPTPALPACFTPPQRERETVAAFQAILAARLRAVRGAANVPMVLC